MAYVNYDKKGKIAYIMLNRSEYNPINFEMVAELDDIWREFQNDDELWVAIVGSAQKNFSAGFDIKAFKKILDEGDFSWKNSAMFGEKRLGPDGHSVTKPIVGAFNGIVNAASMWLTFQSDIRIATPQTVFGFGEGRLNVPVEFAGLLTRYMPRAILNEMLFTGKTVGAQRFYELGIINKIVEQEHLMQEALRIAEDICELGPASVRVMKQLVHFGYEMDHQGLMALSASMIVPVVNSEDTREGMNCFFEKRKPEWKMK